MKQVASFAIDTPVLERFRIAVLRRHGKLHGHLAAEASLALASHAATLEEVTPRE